MKKKMFSFLAVVLFTASFITSNAEVDKNHMHNALPVERSLCATYADFAAALIEEEGGNYYQAWFESFAYCVSQEDYSLNY